MEINIREFRQNLAKYLNLALTDTVDVRMKTGQIIQLIPLGCVHKNACQNEGRVHKESLSDKEQKFQELKKEVEGGKIGEEVPNKAQCSSCDRWVDEVWLIRDNKLCDSCKSKLERGLTVGLEIPKDEIVGTCDICHNPSKELWEHEEEGNSMNICKDCFQARFQGDFLAFERFMRSKRKVEFDYGVKIPVIRGTMKEVAKVYGFNPIPKPVKKKKE